MRKLAVAASCGAVFYCFLTVPVLASDIGKPRVELLEGAKLIHQERAHTCRSGTRLKGRCRYELEARQYAWFSL